MQNNKLIPLKRIFLFAVFLHVLNLAYAQSNKIFVLDKKAESISVDDYLSIFEDTEGNLQIEDVIAQNKFTSFNPDVKQNKSSVYWAKIIIDNQMCCQTDWIFFIGTKRSSDFAELYLYDSAAVLIKTVKSGHFIPKSEKEIKEELGSKFKLSLLPDNKYVIYLKIKNISGFRPSFKTELKAVAKFQKELQKRNLVQGWLQGVLWIMFLYNILIFIYSRDRVYLWYSLYILGLALNFLCERGLFIEYIIPENPRINPYVFILVTGLASVAYFQFLRLFLNTKQKMPLWDKVHIGFIFLNIGITAILLAELAVFFNLPIAINLSNYLNLLGLVYGLVFISYLLKFGNKLARFFVAGTLLLAVGTITSLVYLISKIPLAFDPKYFMNAGTIGEILFFSLGLGYRIRQIENEKQEVQEKLISQLTKNEKLKEKVNRELEDKVRERTAEIEQQKEEILAQSENLQFANALLTKQKREIEQKNEEITVQTKNLERIFRNTRDSINYASKIQATILPPLEILANIFEDYFIFYKPKEVVSGDFYWYKHIEREGKKYFAFAAADATGHGVPGALVSMLGNSLLNETVIRNEVQKASDVLEIIRTEVKSAFRQSDEHILTRDGIDMAFCVLDLDTYELQYSGANRPLLIFNHSAVNENEHFLEFKPDKYPIGVHHKEKPFTNHVIQLEKGNRLYLFSDGFADQIGGPDGRKYYMRRFKELLSEINLLSMTEQFEQITETYKKWIENPSAGAKAYRQVDDILVMGLTI
jgi:serine phosphatase RsbU (regulator of sigma subunit)